MNEGFNPNIKCKSSEKKGQMKNTLFARQKSAINFLVWWKLNINALMTISWDLLVLQILDPVIRIIPVSICSVATFLIVQRLRYGLTHRTMFYLMYQSVPKTCDVIYFEIIDGVLDCFDQFSFKSEWDLQCNEGCAKINKNKLVGSIKSDMITWDGALSSCLEIKYERPNLTNGKFKLRIRIDMLRYVSEWIWTSSWIELWRRIFCLDQSGEL